MMKQSDRITSLKDKWQTRCMASIEAAIQSEPNVCFRVDAPRRSGKTTLAKKLSERYGCRVLVISNRNTTIRQGACRWREYDSHAAADMIILDEWQHMDFTPTWFEQLICNTRNIILIGSPPPTKDATCVTHVYDVQFDLAEDIQEIEESNW